MSLVLVGSVATWQYHRAYGRDVPAYLTYLRTYPGVVTVPEGSDAAEAEAQATRFTTPPAAMVAAGDRACHWLSTQPYAGLRKTAEYRVSAVAQRYNESAPSHDLGWSGYPAADAVGAGAWSFLCPGTLALHKPHWPFGAPTD